MTRRCTEGVYLCTLEDLGTLWANEEAGMEWVERSTGVAVRCATFTGLVGFGFLGR